MVEEPQTLVGAHVDLRPLTVDDAEATFRWRSSERARHLNQGAATVADQVRWIERRPRSEFNYVIQLKDGTPVGMLSLVNVDLENSRAETGRFLIGEEDKVKGVPAAVEAMGLLYKFAFETLGLSRLYGTIASENRLMVKWQKFLGMREEGILRGHYRLNEGFQDAVYLGILRSEYETVFVPRAKVLLAAAT